MNYIMLNLVAAAATAATQAADRFTRLSMRSAASAASLATKADYQAMVYASNKVRANVEAKQRAQQEAEAAYNRCRASFERSTWEAVLRLAELKKKHALGQALTTKVKQ